MSTDGLYVYRVGVIDFMTKHNFKKTLETAVKSTLYRVKKDTVSA